VSERLDWAALLKAGVLGLRLQPSEFWRLTPAELALMLGVGDRAEPMGRSQLAALQARFPDTTRKDATDGKTG
jgi:uncharacterized phage protein (TIGR02216 family)